MEKKQTTHDWGCAWMEHDVRPCTCKSKYKVVNSFIKATDGKKARNKKKV